MNAARTLIGLDRKMSKLAIEVASSAMLLTPEQVRAARGLLGWSRLDLSKVSGVSHNTIKGLELGETDPRRSTLVKLSRTFTLHAIVFVTGAIGDGVVLKR
jgi:ribosome-binding protein aMBF1 (putative translation factor)